MEEREMGGWERSDGAKGLERRRQQGHRWENGEARDWRDKGRSAGTSKFGFPAEGATKQTGMFGCPPKVSLIEHGIQPQER